MPHSVLTGLAVLLGAVFSTAASALTETPGTPSSPPITFFVAKGEPHACGRGCDEWIAADGMIDGGAPQRLRALLNRLGKRKLPIYFHSPGGSVAAALAIGRLMRERGLTAGVAWTLPQGCNAKEPREAACDKLKRSGKDLPAQLETHRTMCNSACVYALVGAAVRELGPAVGLGVHASAITFVDTHSHTRVKPPPHVVRDAMNRGYGRLADYFREMGIDAGLLRAAREIEHSRVRVLTRAEVFRFNIDRRTFVEDGWKLVDEPSRAVLKVFLAGPQPGQAEYRTTLMRLSCSTSDRLRVDFARESVPGEKAGAVSLSAGGMTQFLKPGWRTASLSNKTNYDVSTAYVPRSFFSDAGDSIEISAATETAAVLPPKKDDAAIKLSTAGLAAALAKFLPGCAVAPTTSRLDTTAAPSDQASGPAAPAPRAPPPPFGMRGAPGQALPGFPSTPATPTKPVPPMVFFVAKGDRACGRDCDEWIAAEGTFDSDAPQRLHALLVRLGTRKLPVYFHSPGGATAAALAIGRLLREHGLTAGVAWTVPEGCDRRQPREEGCDRLKGSGRELPARLDTASATCNSACVYALVGGAVRDVPLGVRLGVNSPLIKPPDHGVNGEQITSYLRDMGIDTALLETAREVEHDRIRYLTRAEIWRFNIDRRTFLEGEWKFVTDPSRAVVKLFLSGPTLGQPDYRTAMVRLSCTRPDRIHLELARERVPGIEAGAVNLLAGATTEPLRPGWFARSINKIDYDVSAAFVSPSSLVEAGESIAISAATERAAGEPPNASDAAIRLSTAGLMPALASLLVFCGGAPPISKAVAPISGLQ